MEEGRGGGGEGGGEEHQGKRERVGGEGRELTSDLWEVYYPAAIPIATASFIFGSFW